MAMQQVPREERGPEGPSGPDGGIVEKAWKLQHRIEGRAKGLGKGRYGRVLKMARKPDAEEYNHVAKVTALGILFLGALGFAVFFIMDAWLKLS